MKPTVNILKEIGNVLSPNDPELVEKTLTRLDEQDLWNDVFSTKLIEVLDTLDGIKSESRSALRNAEAQGTDLARCTLSASRIALFGCSLSWTVTAWAIWLAFKSVVPLLIPAIISAILIVSVWFLARRVASAA